MDYAIPLDTTRAVNEGIKEIVETLLIAIALVIAVVYLFLQGWRSTLIPLLAVPVSLIGTFVFFPLFGFTINTLSLFGLVLAIGLVVDDAIVVVEAVERHIEDGLAPKQAALKAMEEISGPVIGIALVLSAVFMPTAFIPGITGRLYQQFAVTIAISVILSAFNALSLSPALAALLLKPKTESRGPLAKFFDWFNRLSSAPPTAMSACPERCFARAPSLWFSWPASPRPACGSAAKCRRSFVPDEDQGYFYLNVQLPNAASLQRTEEVVAKIEKIAGRYAGRGVHHQRLRLQPAQLRAHQLQRRSFRQHEGMERAAKAASRAVPGDQGAPQRGIEQASRRRGLRLLAARHSRRRHLRRIHLHSRRPRRAATSSSCRTT